MRERENNTFRRKKKEKEIRRKSGFIFKSGEGPLLGG